MATRTTTVDSEDFLASVGGTITNTDIINICDFNRDYKTNTNIAAYDLTALIFKPGFRGRFRAADSGPLTAVVNQSAAGYVQNYSNSPRIELQSTGPTAVINRVEHNPARKDGQMQLAACDCARLDVAGGVFIAASDCDLAAAYLVGGHTYLLAGSYACPTLIVAGNAYCALSRDITNATIGDRAVLELLKTAVVPASITMYGGTLRIYQSGTITSLVGYSGVIDITGASILPTISGGELGPGVVIRQSRAQDALNLASVTLRHNGPRYEYVD